MAKKDEFGGVLVEDDGGVDEFGGVIDKSAPSVPGMEKLGGTPPPAPKPPLPKFIRKSDPKEAAREFEAATPSAASSLGKFIASPVTGLIGAPGEVIDWVKRGGHNPGPSGGFATENPLAQAYGNALATVGEAYRTPTAAPKPVPPLQKLRSGLAGDTTVPSMSAKAEPWVAPSKPTPTAPTPSSSTGPRPLGPLAKFALRRIPGGKLATDAYDVWQARQAQASTAPKTTALSLEKTIAAAIKDPDMLPAERTRVIAEATKAYRDLHPGAAKKVPVPALRGSSIPPDIPPPPGTAPPPLSGSSAQRLAGPTPRPGAAPPALRGHNPPLEPVLTPAQKAALEEGVNGGESAIDEALRRAAIRPDYIPPPPPPPSAMPDIGTASMSDAPRSFARAADQPGTGPPPPRTGTPPATAPPAPAPPAWTPKDAPGYSPAYTDLPGEMPMGNMTQLNKDIHAAAGAKGIAHDKQLGDILAQKFKIQSMKQLTPSMAKELFKDLTGQDWHPDIYAGGTHPKSIFTPKAARTGPPAPPLPPDIPQFAHGGIIRKPTLLIDIKSRKPVGLMGEAGPEAIMPLPSSKFNLRSKLRENVKHIFAKSGKIGAGRASYQLPKSFSASKGAEL